MIYQTGPDEQREFGIDTEAELKVMPIGCGWIILLVLMVAGFLAGLSIAGWLFIAWCWQLVF